MRLGPSVCGSFALSGYGTKWPIMGLQNLVASAKSMYRFALFAAGLALVLGSINAMNESSSRFRSKIGTATLCPAAVSHRNRSTRFVRRDARGHGPTRDVGGGS